MHPLRPLSFGAALLAGLVIACSGKLAGSPGGDAGGPGCVDVDLSTYDVSCTQDSDCMEVTAGQLCESSCMCGGSVINVSGAARYMSQTSGIEGGGCPCPYSGAPTCSAGTCTLCLPGENCSGIAPVDAAVSPPSDGGACVDVESLDLRSLLQRG